MQQAGGCSFCADGEWSRENYIGDMLSRIEGVGADSASGEGLLDAMPLDVLCYYRRMFWLEKIQKDLYAVLFKPNPPNGKKTCVTV